jgi:cytochrome c6
VWEDETCSGLKVKNVIKRLGSVFLSVVLGWLMVALPIGAAEIPEGAQASEGANVFELHCAGCHANGGNIVRRGKTLKLKALERNGYGTEEMIAAIVTNGKGNMSAYNDHLTPAQIQAVSAYVLDRAHHDWR